MRKTSDHDGLFMAIALKDAERDKAVAPHAIALLRYRARCELLAWVLPRYQHASHASVVARHVYKTLFPFLRR